MNTQEKIILTVQMDGRLGGKGEKEFIRYHYNTNVDGKKIADVTGTVKHVNKATQSCTRKTVLTQDAYNHFVSGETPHWAKDFIWSKLNKTQRVKAHCERIAEGRPFNIEILGE